MPTLGRSADLFSLYDGVNLFFQCDFQSVLQLWPVWVDPIHHFHDQERMYSAEICSVAVVQKSLLQFV